MPKAMTSGREFNVVTVIYRRVDRSGPPQHDERQKLRFRIRPRTISGLQSKRISPASIATPRITHHYFGGRRLRTSTCPNAGAALRDQLSFDQLVAKQ